MSSRKRKSPGCNLGGDVTRDGVRHNHSTASRGQDATDSAIIWHAGRVVGEVREENGERVFQKRVRGSVHLLRAPRAAAWDVTALHEAERLGATGVLIIDVETGREYRAPLATVWAKGWEFNRGHGRQWALRLEAFNRPEEPAQLSLFEGTA